MTELGFYKKPQYIKRLVKQLKYNETVAERLLRIHIRNKQINGYKFYRQKAIFVYRESESWDRFIIADFYCHKYKLIIEVDGGIHNNQNIRNYDKMKEHLLKNLGYVILRFTNEDVVSNISKILKNIKDTIAYIEVL